MADPQLDGRVEGLHAAGGPLVVGGVAGRVQRPLKPGDRTAPAAHRDERGQPAPGRRRADQHLGQEPLGLPFVPGAVVAGPAVRPQRPGDQHRAGRAAQLLLRDPVRGPRAAVGHLALPAHLVAGHRQPHQHLAGGGRGALRQRRQRLREQLPAVGEAAVVRHQQAGAAGAAGRCPPGVVARGPAPAPPAVPGQQRAEHRRIEPCGIQEPRVVIVGRPVHQGLPPAPTRVMISQSARSSKIRAVGIRTVVLRRPVTGWPARLIQ